MCPFLKFAVVKIYQKNFTVTPRKNLQIISNYTGRFTNIMKSHNIKR
jgi:hypothetical protein